MNGNNSASEKAAGGRILIIDDDEGMCYTLSRMSQEEGHSADSALTLKDGLSLALAGEHDVIFLDVRLPDGSGLDIIPGIQAMPAPPEIIIITGYGDKEGAKTALKSGVWDYIEKPARINALKLSLKRALQYRRQKKTLQEPLSMDRCGIIGSGSRLQMCLELMSHAAASAANVLIIGETGSGKELFARAIHKNSARASEPFVVVDCAALPQNLAESILFGHVKGSFTGADKDSPGLIKKADGGTLFLDEVGELPLSLQKTFLRVLQEKKFLPVGGQEEVKSNFRIISATNRDLDSEVESGAFRQDLLFRLRTFVIELPALRERKRDIREIVVDRVNKICEDEGDSDKIVSDEFLEILNQYEWPGNVRELINTVDSALAMEPTCPTLYPKHIPEYIRINTLNKNWGEIPGGGTRLSPLEMNPEFPTMKEFRLEAVEDAERQYLNELMQYSGGDFDRACAVSGLKRARLYQLLKKYNVEKQE